MRWLGLGRGVLSVFLVLLFLWISTMRPGDLGRANGRFLPPVVDMDLQHREEWRRGDN